MFGLTGVLRSVILGLMVSCVTAVGGFTIGYRYRGAEFEAKIAEMRHQADLLTAKRDAGIASAVGVAVAEAAKAEATSSATDSAGLSAIEALRVASDQPSVISTAEIGLINKMIEEASR